MDDDLKKRLEEVRQLRDSFVRDHGDSPLTSEHDRFFLESVFTSLYLNREERLELARYKDRAETRTLIQNLVYAMIITGLIGFAILKSTDKDKIILPLFTGGGLVGTYFLGQRIGSGKKNKSDSN
jgi:hypothetical protein